MTVRGSLGQLFVRNWPIKLAALFFAIMLYVAVAAQQPLSQSFAMRLVVATAPSRARLVGPEKSLAKLASVTTLPTVISSVSGPFFQTVPIDTAPLGVIRISPKAVRMAGEVTAIIERSIGGVPITTAASGFTGFLLTPERVSVTVRGPASRVNTLTRDSLRVGAALVGKAGPGGYARLTVTGPPGIAARAVPDSVSLKRKTGRG